MKVDLVPSRMRTRVSEAGRSFCEKDKVKAVCFSKSFNLDFANARRCFQAYHKVIPERVFVLRAARPMLDGRDHGRRLVQTT